MVQRVLHYLADPATWRDQLWTAVDPLVVTLTAAIPIGLVLEGVYGFVITAFWKPLTDHGYQEWYTFLHVTKGSSLPHWSTAALGSVLMVLGLWCAPAMLRLNAAWSRSFLAPTARAALAQRVERLTVTRTDAVDAQAAEIRRIERDLHDGAQARLVAMGMNLNAAARVLEKNPDAARTLLLQARDSSAQALTELRDLVRGIHPPILADRGLGDAVRALALDSPLDVQVSVELPERLAAPIESAAYFAVNEVLANAAKHSGANHVWVDLRHDGRKLTITVTDDGIGGADGAEGSGLRGIERRLATFDGIVAVTSPIGGPTVVTMELPCESSSPRTSSS